MLDYLVAILQVGIFSYSPPATLCGHSVGGEILLLAHARLSGHSTDEEILLLAPCWTSSLPLSLGRFSFSPCARLRGRSTDFLDTILWVGRFSYLPMLDFLVAVLQVGRLSYMSHAGLSHCRSAGGKILLQTSWPFSGWGYSLTCPVLDFLMAVPRVGRFSYLLCARLPHCCSAGGEILLLTSC